MLKHGCRTIPSSGRVYIFQRVLGKREGEGWKGRGNGWNCIAKFGRFGYIRGASEDQDIYIS
jgi:hypothetical protein